MADDTGDILKDEEINSGFEAHEPGDETFLLDSMDKYPGELPDFSFEGESGSITAKPEEAVAAEPETSDEPTEPPGLYDPVQAETESAPETAEATEAKVELDPELLDLMKGDLAKSTKKREKKSQEAAKEPEPEPIAEPEHESEPEAYIPAPTEEIEAEAFEERPFPEFKDEDSSEIDITDMDAERPSTYQHEETGMMGDDTLETAATGMQLTKPRKKPAVKPDDSADVREKRFRKKMPAGTFWIPASVFAFLAVTGIIAYFFLFRQGGLYNQFDKKSKTVAVAKPAVKETKPEVIKKDTVKTPAADSAEKPVATKDSATPVEVSKPAGEPVQKKITVTEKPEKKAPEKKLEIPETKQPKEKPVIAKKEKQEDTKIPEKKKEPVITADNKQEAPKENTKQLEAPSKETKTETYTVQVYSSPMKEDAEEWLERLQRKNVSGAFISAQVIRDKIWYRVRFGEFRNKDEARSAALKYGFAQSWVDRVR